MLRLTLFTLLTLFVSALQARVSSDTTKNIYLEEKPTYQIYTTDNADNFLKLDTRNGRIWLLQLNNKKEYRFTSPINDVSLIKDNEEEKNGRFILKPTTHYRRYILFDQTNGKVWQVDWEFDHTKRVLNEIPQE